MCSRAGNGGGYEDDRRLGLRVGELEPGGGDAHGNDGARFFKVCKSGRSEKVVLI